MPWRWASDQRMSDETEPPRWVCSSARPPSIRRSLVPADHGPAPSGEARGEQGEPGPDQDVERGPDADDPPAEGEREDRQGHEEPACRQHRPHQVARVARAEQDPVEGEDGTAARKGQSSAACWRTRGSLAKTRGRTCARGARSAAKSAPTATDQASIRRAAAYAPAASPAPSSLPTSTCAAIAIASSARARKRKSW